VIDLAGIVVLYREPDSLSLWGIPYAMRREIGQEPRHILPHLRRGWIWLGCPGWYGSLERSDIERIKVWRAALEVADPGIVPGGPHEWSEIPESLRGLASQ
jgi:hypothetical protein